MVLGICSVTVTVTVTVAITVTLIFLRLHYYKKKLPIVFKKSILSL